MADIVEDESDIKGAWLTSFFYFRLAFWKVRKGKSTSSLVEQYRQNLDKNLIKLRPEILSGDVEVGHYRHFFHA